MLHDAEVYAYSCAVPSLRDSRVIVADSQHSRAGQRLFRPAAWSSGANGWEECLCVRTAPPLRGSIIFPNRGLTPPANTDVAAARLNLRVKIGFVPLQNCYLGCDTVSDAHG